MCSNNQLQEQLQVLVEGNKCDNAKDHLHIIEMVLQIDDKKALDALHILTKSILKKQLSLMSRKIQ